MNKDWSVLAARAELLKAIAHPVRLCILRGLAKTPECNVSHMQECLGLPQSTVSQHLARLRLVGLIGARRQGVEVYYSLVDPCAARVIEALEL
ncbi:MAG: metalloregulator ArsR/SmtB family transcription factor [Bacillota bacterium]